MPFDARSAFTAAGAAIAAVSTIAMPAPAIAAINNQDPAALVSGLTGEGFAAMRTGDKTAAKQRFRQLLLQHVAVAQIGDRLIARWKAQITPAQYQAYQASFPNFIVGTYTDNLFNYADATVRVTATRAAGNGAAVSTTVTKPGAAPIVAVWTVTGSPNGYKVSNITVAGVNIALAQQQDFNAYIQRNGFDRFLAFLHSRQ
jgi:phospholipid transport system substrate-binding protein